MPALQAGIHPHEGFALDEWAPGLRRDDGVFSAPERPTHTPHPSDNPGEHPDLRSSVYRLPPVGAGLQTSNRRDHGFT